jgi:hypothetical protein
MESPGEIESHQRRERGKEGKVGSCKVESPNKIQGKLIKGGKKECSSMESLGKIRDRGFGREACQSVIRACRGFQILLENEAKILSHNL